MIGAQGNLQAAEHAVLVAGLAGMVADALSMGSSGYLAAKSEREVFEHEQLVNRSDGVVRQVVIGGKLAWDGEDFTEDFGHTRMGRLLTAGPRALAREGQARRPLAVPPEVTLH